MEKEGTQADWGGADIDDFEQRKEEWAEKFGEETRYYLAYTQGSSPEIVTEQEVRDRKMWILEDVDIDDIKSELGEDV